LIFFVKRFLASVNLPAAIEDSGGRQIPPSVIEKSNEIKRQGGVSALDKMISDLPESLTRNKEILDEVIFSFVFLLIDHFYLIRQFEC
jgi:programmed cell death 6-interacting protein